MYDAKCKADLFADVFGRKGSSRDIALPCPLVPIVKMSEFCLVRTRWVFTVLAGLSDGACGPDLLPSRILHECRSEIAYFIARLIRCMLANAYWPDVWRVHWLCPLYKRNAQSTAGNYRGVHLTSILSKVCERVIARTLVKFLDSTDAYGSRQWAYRPRRSARDFVTLLVCTWLLAFRLGRKVSLFLADIAGAFDRVDSRILLIRLKEVGVSDTFCAFVKSYLAARRAIVIVQGNHSESYPIGNEVFQGTVLGPPLWNVFFSSVSVHVQECGYLDAKFADDSSAFKSWSSSIPDEVLMDDMKCLQSRVHAWGVQNRVCFDAGKAHMLILHRTSPVGSSFKLLGVVIDPKLVMQDETSMGTEKGIAKNARYPCDAGFLWYSVTHWPVQGACLVPFGVFDGCD